MNKLLATALLLALVASQAFANKNPKLPHQKYNYTYHAPKAKYKAPKDHNRHSHPHQAHKAPSH
jgi:hypothetical protein